MSEIKKAAIIGAGIMGNGIAQVLAQAGFEVAMTDIEDKFIQRGIASIKKSLGRMKKRGKIAEDEVDNVLGRIKGTLDLKEAVSDADLVIEAIPEDLNLKQQAFKQLDELCPAHTVLATNTSTISITAIASVTQRQDYRYAFRQSGPSDERGRDHQGARYFRGYPENGQEDRKHDGEAILRCK